MDSFGTPKKNFYPKIVNIIYPNALASTAHIRKDQF